MMKQNFDLIFSHLIESEGGFVNDPRDNGGATNLGVTIGTMRRLGMDLDKDGDVDVDDVRLVTRKDAAKVFRENFWNVVRADDLPSGLDYVAADAAYHSGPSRGAKWLQHALQQPQTGRIADEDISAAKAQPVDRTITRALYHRMAFLKQLSDWKHFAKGWSQRIARVSAVSRQLAEKESGRGFWAWFVQRVWPHLKHRG